IEVLRGSTLKTLVHEGVHKWIFESLPSFLQPVRKFLYNFSGIYRGTEEAIAQAVASTSLSEGFNFGFRNPAYAGRLINMGVELFLGGLSVGAAAGYSWASQNQSDAIPVVRAVLPPEPPQAVPGPRAVQRETATQVGPGSNALEVAVATGPTGLGT